MNPIVNAIKEAPFLTRIVENIENKKLPCFVKGTIDQEEAHLIYSVYKKTRKPFMLITYSENKAKQLYNDLFFYMQEKEKNSKIFHYTSKDLIFYNADVHSSEITKNRLKCVNHICENDFSAVILSIEALVDKLIPKQIFEAFSVELVVGEEINLDGLLESLISMGYERSATTESIGQFSQRGGIIDVFSPIYENPFRLELWGDEIDSIRVLDQFSQRSVESVRSFKIFPTKEFIYTDEVLKKASQDIKSDLDAKLKLFSKNEMFEDAKELNDNVSSMLESLSESRYTPLVENYKTYFYDDFVSLIDYMPKDSLIFVDNYTRIKESFDFLFAEFEQSFEKRVNSGLLLKSGELPILDYSFISGSLQKSNTVFTSSIFEKPASISFKDEIEINVKSFTSFQNQFDILFDELIRLKKDNYKGLLFAGPNSRCLRFQEELSKRGLELRLIKTAFDDEIDLKGITICPGSISGSFTYPDEKFAILSDKELLGGRKSKKRKSKKDRRPIENFMDLKIGDYVVHDSHGIGLYQGIEQVIIDNNKRDFMKINYADGGNLFVPTTQLESLQKYMNKESAGKVKLHKLGGSEWSRTKAKVRSAVKEIAEDLVLLYAKRQAMKGFQFSKDSVWQKEFEETFEFEETEDQILAIEDVKSDMESEKIMDRLICGDVGYGKTEIALRAAFKAVNDGKQVALLVPTTILAQQHFNTFVDRMSDFPISIEMLSRFRTAKEIKMTLKRLETGNVDIVIGTHRILSQDVAFKNLGLVVVDEEQRFGVSHKERLKVMTKLVDVLTLTATPIPRTMHMSLSGIRDMSILEEPPSDRRPIQTYVMEYNIDFVRDAIEREIGRGGQVYYLHNRVKNISEVSSRIQEILPNSVVAYAHGQMSERELESIILSFIEGEIDVLVCTTIIETGLDIPNVNTIIINGAEHMGLAQLYQLRGRVGRSNKLAYAYLMYKKDKVLREVAEKRLQTIKEFTEFGSGFKIAMRDLEIRGAGSLFGAEQSGHFEAVGYEMYSKLLQDAILEAKGHPLEKVFETYIDVNTNAFIPESYIENEEQKLEIYKKISLIRNMDDYLDVQDELLDRFGDMTRPVANLMEIALIKSTANSLSISSIYSKNENIIFKFYADAKISINKLTMILEKNIGKIWFTNGTNPYLTYAPDSAIDILSNIKNMLHLLTS